MENTTPYKPGSKVWILKDGEIYADSLILNVDHRFDKDRMEVTVAPPDELKPDAIWPITYCCDNMALRNNPPWLDPNDMSRRRRIVLDHPAYDVTQWMIVHTGHSLVLEQARAINLYRDWLRGMTGGYFTALLDAMKSADSDNLCKLHNAYPELVDVHIRYREEVGFAQRVGLA